MNEQIINKLLKMMDEKPDLKTARYLFSMVQNTGDKELNKQAREIYTRCARKSDPADAVQYMDLYWKTRLWAAQNGSFDDYMLYLEKNRPAKERFYQPRRSKLKPAVDMIQDMLDDKLDEGVIELPPRVGKTTIIMFMFSYIIGLRPETSNLYSAYSSSITTALYTGVLEIITDKDTYLWSDVFPDRKIARTNAADLLLDINRQKRYASLTCRSLYGTLNGACDCEGFLVADDLLSGIEESLSPDRLDTAWGKTDNNLLSRAKRNAKILFVGTRWSLRDPAGRRIDLVQNDEKFRNRRHRVLHMPALNENDESNFDYDYGVGFDTEYYQQRRASFERNDDVASWMAQYQQEPIEREGALFSPAFMNFYNGVLPEGEPDRIFMACDTAFGGGDYVSAPVAVQYGDAVYIPSVIFDNGDKFVTRPRVAKQILDYKVGTSQFEKNNGGEDYAEWVDKWLRDREYRHNMQTRSAPTNKRKEARIFEKAPEIREYYFLEDGKRDKDYSLFMQNLFSFKITGKNKNDDAPDSLAMLADMINKGSKPRAVVFQRPF